jgi:DNA/RNA endonuclease YhcR with UshA esterase domain
MRIWIKSLLGIVFIILFFTSNNTAKAVENTNVVSINELLWSGSHVSSSDEFIELKNNTDHNIDLTGWQITALDSKKNEYLMITIPSGVIPAEGYFLIANSEKDYIYKDGESVLNIDPDLVDSSLSLSNANLQIKIYDGQWDDGRLPIDIAGNGNKPLEGNTANKNLELPDSSMERDEFITNGAEKTSWKNKNECKENELNCQKNLDANSPEWATPESSGKPEITEINVSYNQISNKNETQSMEMYTEINDTNGINDIDKVEVNLASIGGEPQYNLIGSDEQCLSNNCKIFKNKYDLNVAPVGEKEITFTVYDKKGLVTSSKINLEFFNLSSDIFINEIFPAPDKNSENEFVELYNSGDKNIDLYGWKLDDVVSGGSAPFTISNSIISAKGFLTFYKKETKITLNNNKDKVRLIDPFGYEIDAIAYGQAIKNFSYNKTDDGWKWSEIITPNSINIISRSNISDTNHKQYKSLSVKQAKNESNNSLVELTGIVNSLPKLFSKNYFYIEDDESGIEIYSHDGDFPPLNYGDKIKVKGIIAHTSSGWRLKIKDKDAIEIIESNYYILPKSILPEENLENYEGMLVKVVGIVLESSGDTFYIGNNSGKIKVYVQKLTNIEKPRITKGMILEITGIISYYKNGWRIMPRFQDDIYVNTVKENDNFSIISKAYATENTKPSVITLEKLNFYNTNKAKEITNKNVYEQLIKITEIVIIISIILLIFSVGKKYVAKQ